MQFKECGADYAFLSGRIDGREEKIYSGQNYYYAGAYEQGFNLGILEVDIIQNKIDMLNNAWHEAHLHENMMLSVRIGYMRDDAILELRKLKRGEDL